jgi:hypothetical protein
MVQDSSVKCVNCNEPHPANYTGCVVHKQLQQKIFPKLRERHITTPTQTVTTTPIQNIVTYSQVVQGQPNTPPTPSMHMPQPGNYFMELKQMMKNLIDQMSTLINLMSQRSNFIKQRETTTYNILHHGNPHIGQVTLTNYQISLTSA